MIVQNSGYVKLATVIVPSTIWDYPAAFFIGAIGGFCGAFYIWFNLEINKIRKKLLTSNIIKIIECLLLAFITSTCFYWVPSLYSDCMAIPEGGSEEVNL